MHGERTVLFDCLYRRVGELISHLGRYDMQLLSIACMLTSEVVLRHLIENWPVETRIDVIDRLMQARDIPANFQTQFSDIHHQMKPILERQKICAAHPAVVTQIGFKRPWELPARPAATHDWFRTETVSADEIDRSIATVERDIMTAAKLYLSLATLSSRLQRWFFDSESAPAGPILSLSST